MYNVKADYIKRLREFLLHSSSLRLEEDAINYVSSYDDTLLQGFLVWDYSSYLAKEYEFDGVQRVDFFIIPTYGGLVDETTCTGLQYIGINIDVHRDIDQTGQRMDLIIQQVKNWHRELLTTGICPIVLPTGENYMVLPNGVTPAQPLSNQPYSRATVKFKLDYIQGSMA